MKKIFLDPGHGGADSGCVSSTGVREADVVMKIAHLMHQIPLLDQDCPVLYTTSRLPSECPTKSARADRARQFKADAALVLHFNAAPGDTNETQIYFDTYRPKIWVKNPELSIGLPVHEIPVSKAIPLTDYRRRAYNCLKNYAEIPAILIELAFLDRKKTLDFLAADGTTKFAQDLHKYVLSCLEESK